MIEIGNTSKTIDTHSSGPTGMRVPYQDYARVIDICCIAMMLRNFPMTSLRGEEIDEFLRLQSFFTGLEARCLDEAGFE